MSERSYRCICDSPSASLPSQSRCARQLPQRGSLGQRQGSPLYNLSVCFADNSPSRGASGEEGKLNKMPRPLLGRRGGSASALTERFFSHFSVCKNRAAGNVRTCGAVYLLEEIVLVENGSLNPVGTIRIVYFIWRKKSTRVAKIGGTCSCTKQNTLKSLDSKVFQTGAAIQIRTGDLILTKDALYQLSYSSKWRPGSGSNRRPPA